MLSDQSGQMTNDYAYKHTYKIHAVVMVAIGIHLLKIPAYGHVLWSADVHFQLPNQ